MSKEIDYSRTSLMESDSNKVNHCSNADTPDTSTLMSDILRLDNINADELNLLSQSILITECVNSSKDHEQAFKTGSMIDCSFFQGSDVDVMVQVPDTEVTDVESYEASQAGTVFVMDTKGSAPGYTFLILKGQNLDNTNTKCFFDFYDHDSGFLSSKLYLECEVKMMKNKLEILHLKGLTNHGPCAMMNFPETGYNFDHALGLKCFPWPKEAMEWISRRRESNWPDAALIDKIKTMPCHVLPVGSPDSDKCSLEWRFAFILQERELIWNLNGVQIQCFVVLKTLKKEILDKKAPDEINSFHLKTILFWLSETSIKWEESTLFDNVRRCLIFLNDCILKKHLSHYFIRSRNLFAGKLGDEEVRTCLLSEISRIQRNILECFMDCKLSYIRDNGILQNTRLLLKKEQQLDFLSTGKTYLQNSQITNLKYQIQRKKARARGFGKWATIIVTAELNETFFLKILKKIDKLQDTLIKKYAVMYLSTRRGMLRLVKARETVDINRQKFLISEAKRFIKSGMKQDVLAGRMYLINYYYFTRSYDKIVTFLKELFRTRLAISYEQMPDYRKCGKRSILSPDMDETVNHEDIKNHSTVCFDVVFGVNDSCVPPAIQFECALLNYNFVFCSINPLVYASYVQFQVAFDQKDLELLQPAVEHLQRTVLYVQNGEGTFLELYRHYNILGYCYYVMNDERNAIKWFVKSLDAWPNMLNAAAYHMCIIFLNSEHLISKMIYYQTCRWFLCEFASLIWSEFWTYLWGEFFSHFWSKFYNRFK